MSLFRHLLLFFSFAGLSFNCNHRGVSPNRGDVDLDQDVTSKHFPQDSTFLHFAQNWKKFINPSLELHKPVLERQVATWTPAVIADCRYSTTAGHNIPVVELSWNEEFPPNGATTEMVTGPAATRNLRFDISLNYKGFERNYYTTVFPIARNQRFSIPEISTLVRDTSAVLMTGPSLLPKVVDFQQIRVRVNEKEMLKKILHLTDLGPGAAYRIRSCTLNGEAWMPSAEFIFNTPICPVDSH